MKKILLPIILFSLLLLAFFPATVNAQGIVPCDGVNKKCDLCMFFSMLVGIYDFIVLQIATPLAIVAVIVGGILMMISAGNPNLLGLGKKIFYAAIIGLILVFCSWLIIDFILKSMGYNANGGNWSSIQCGGGNAPGDTSGAGDPANNYNTND